MISRTSRARVCHFTSVHMHDDDRIFLKQCRSLARAGYETHLVAPQAPNGMRDGVRLHSVSQTHQRRLQRMTVTVGAVYRKVCAIDADIYHFHDPELIPVGLLLRACGKRVVYDVHEDVPRQLLLKPYLPQPIRRPMSWITERVEQSASSRFSAVVTTTPAIAARFRPINPRTVVVNNYPLRDELIAPHPVAWQRRASAVAYAGSITTARGILQVVEAMEYVSERIPAKLELAGSFSPSEERAQATTLRGWAHVCERGWLGRAEVAHLLGSVRGGLVTLHPWPTYVVSQPIKFFEYMAAGIPVIASDFPLWREFIEQVRCGLLVNPLDARDIARAIEFVLTQSDEAEAMGRRGREAVESHYNWEAEVSKLVQLYDSLRESAAH